MLIEHVIERNDSRLREIRNMRNILQSCADTNYSKGFADGLEWALAIIENRIPIFKEDKK